MNIKISALTAAILAGLSTGAMALNTPPDASALLGPDNTSLYGNGPSDVRLNTTNLSVAERSAFALMEGVMQIAEAKIYATNCGEAAFNLEVYADGINHAGSTILNTIYNQATVTTAGGSNAPQFSLGAFINAPVTNRGQMVQVKLQGAGGVLGGTAIQGYEANNFFNNQNNMMVNTASIGLIRGDGVPDAFSSSVIKDFYRGSANIADREYYNIYDWGLQSVLKQNYPVNKYWQRSKVRRDNGVNGHTKWVKDRLVGTGVCRITLDTNGYNDQQPLFWQGNSITGGGTLTIQSVAPNATIDWTTNF